MELREWLIILGLALVTLIVIDGFRRLQRQRSVPRLDRVGIDARDARGDPQDRNRLDPEDPEEAARQAEINWELPNGGARVVSPADFSSLQAKPKLERQEHPGPSRVLSAWKASTQPDIRARSKAVPSRDAASPSPLSAKSSAKQQAERPSVSPAASHQTDSSPERREPRLSTPDDTTTAVDPGPLRPSEPLVADPVDHDDFQDEDRYRLVDFDGMGDSFKSGSRRVGDSVQRFGASLQKTLAERRDNKRLQKQRRDQEKAEKAARASAQRQRDDTSFTHHDSLDDARHDGPAPEMATQDAAPADDSRNGDSRNDVVRTHPVLEKALRHDVSAEHARQALSHSEEIIVISIMSREEEGFSGTALLDLMLACGLRYSRDMGIFHRFETEDPESRLQFSMVNALKPGIFPIEAMDDFHTPGVTLLMPLPGASDTAAAFEAMVETAMVIVRNLGGELKDENLSVMTAQTVEFARQRVQEFERRNRLNRYQVN